MKKVTIVVLVLILVAVLVWYFVFSKKQTPSASAQTAAPSPDNSATLPNGTVQDNTTPLPPGTNTVSGPDDSTIHTNAAVNVVDSTPSSGSSDAQTINVSTLPDLTTLRAMNWGSDTYTGSIDPNDLTIKNYLIDFKPVSSPLALIGYNSNPAFTAKLCTTSATDCSYVNIGPSGFPYLITYGNILETYVSSDLKTLYMIRKSDSAIIKKIYDATGTVVTGGEGAIVQVTPIASDLNNLSWNIEKFIASTTRFGGDYASFISNLNPMYGYKQGVRVVANNLPDLQGLFCRKANGDAPYCDAETITKSAFPYIIIYPDRMRSNGQPFEFAYISANQRRVILAKIIDGEKAGTVRVFKEYTR